MDWNKKLQMIIDYVEDHLQNKEEAIDPEEIAKMAGCSFSFFQKLFSYLNGISFAEYIRARKLTLAGYTLKSTKKKIIDISYQYGYNSPTSFTKAFQQFHGISPTEARKQEIKLKVVPKMQINQQDEYSWRIEKKSALRLIGKRINISYLENDPKQKIPEFWHMCQKDGTFSSLVSLDTANPKGLFGLFRCL